MGNYDQNPGTNVAGQESQATFEVQITGLNQSDEANASITFTSQVPTQQLEQAVLSYYGDDDQWHTAAFYNGTTWVQVGPSGDTPIQEQDSPVSGSAMSTISLPVTFSNDTSPAITDLDGTVFTLTVPAPISLSSLICGTVNQAYNQTITASGGTGDVDLTVSNVTGSVPGLSIPTSGINTLEIAGTPTAAGTLSFTIRATDSVGMEFSQNYTLMVTTADPTKSFVSLAPGIFDVTPGTPVPVTLTAIDISGNPETTGGLAVAFGLGSGSGNGTFSAVTDNGNGTYTAEFTGTTAGSNTIIATMNGQAVTTSAFVIVTPGPVDLAQSTLSASAAALPVGGVTTVKLTTEDAYGNQEAGNGLTVALSLASGAGSFSPVIDNGDGTYTATFTATTQGNDNIVATINNQAVTSSPVGVIVVGLSLAQSNVSSSSLTIPSSGTTTLTLTAKDVSGAQEATGGLQVAFEPGRALPAAAWEQWRTMEMVPIP